MKALWLKNSLAGTGARACLLACLIALGMLVRPGLAEPKNFYSSLSLGQPVFSPDGKQLALGLYFDYEQNSETISEVEIYQTDSNQRVAHFWQPNWMVGLPPADLAFSPDGSLLAATWYTHEDVSGARGSTVVWELASGKSLPLEGECNQPGLRLDFLDASRLKLGSKSLHSRHTDNAYLHLCDLTTGQSLAFFPNITALQSVPELNLLIGSGYITEYDGNDLVYHSIVRLYDATSYRLLDGLPKLTDLYDLNVGKHTAEAITAVPKPRRVRLDLKQRKLMADLGPFVPARVPAETAPDNDDESRHALAGGRQLRIVTGSAGYDSTLLEILDAKGQRLLSRKLPARDERDSISQDKTLLALLACEHQPDTRCELGLWRLSDLRLMRSWPIEIDAARRDQPPTEP